MKVWIDQDLCTGDGLCAEICPEVFVMQNDGLAYVKEGDKIFAEDLGNPQGAEGQAVVPKGKESFYPGSRPFAPTELQFEAIGCIWQFYRTLKQIRFLFDHS